jgi:di/tricarboxylate transporter
MEQGQILVLAIVVAAFALLITERLRNDIVAVLIVVALYVTHVSTAQEALAGFSSEPAIVVAAIFVLSASLHQTGLSDTVGAWIGRLAGGSLTRALAVIMPSVAVLSAFTHHVTTTAIMLPIALNVSRAQNIPASKLLMPLSFAASLGTTITIIGAPAFLIASGILQQAGRPALGVFSIAPIGLALSVAGTLFVLVARFLLPVRQGTASGSDRYRLENYLTELAILPESPYIGKSVQEIGGGNGSGYSFEVLRRVGAPATRARASDRPIEAGDVLLIRTSPDEMAEIRDDPGVELRPIDQYKPQSSASGNEDDDADLLVQTVVAAGSEVVGRTIREVDFRRRYGVIVVALWRQGDGLADEMDRVRLHAGDVLVLQGDDQALSRVANDRAFLMVLPFEAQPRIRRRAPLAGAIMLATVLAAAFNWMSIEMAALAGAVAVVLTRCVTPRQAYAAIDARIYVFIAGAIPLGAAMQKTGASQVIGSTLQHAVSGWGSTLILLAVFCVVAILTQFMSDSATTALFAPIAVALAQGLGHNPEAYVVTVAMASVVAFLTPIGHHGNLLIYGPGGYRFSDFVRVGAPLTAICALIVVFLAPLVWPL